MAAAYDIQLEATTTAFYGTGDLLITNGDFAIGLSDSQHVQDTIMAYAGWWKQYPADGVGLLDYFNAGANFQQLAKLIKQQLTIDGYKVNPLPKITINNGNLEINPNAVRV